MLILSFIDFFLYVEKPMAFSFVCKDYWGI